MAALFAAAWALAAVHPPASVGDDAQYLAQAENLEAGRPPYAGEWDDTPRDPARYSLRPPGYAAFLVVVRVVSESRLWLAAVQAGMGALTWGLVWVLLGVIQGKRRAGPLVAGLLATPATLIYPTLAMSDTLFALLFTVAFWRFAVFVRDGHARDLVAMHAVLAVALWVKPVVVYFWPFTLALSAWALWRRSRLEGGGGLDVPRGGAPSAPRRIVALWPAVTALLVFASALGVARLHATWTGYPEVTSLQTLNLVQQNAYRTLLRTGETDVYAPAEAAAARIDDYGARQDARQAWATGVILDRPLSYAAVHLTGVAAFVLDPGRFDLATALDLPPTEAGGMTAASREGAAGALSVLARQPPLLLAVLSALLVLNGLVAAAFFGWLVWGAVPVEVRVGAFVFVGYVAAVTGPVGAARYRMAVAPIVALALPWAWGVVRRLLGGRSPEAAALLGGLVLLAGCAGPEPSSEPGLRFTGDAVFSTPDADGDGWAEQLLALVPVEIVETGDYHFSFVALYRDSVLVSSKRLWASAGTNWASVSGGPGSDSIRVEFSGEAIRESGLDGPYTFTLTLNQFGPVRPDGTPVRPRVSATFTSPPYRHDRFGEHTW